VLTGHRRETDQGLRLGARLKDCGPRIGADVFSDLKVPESTAPLGMRLALCDALATGAPASVVMAFLDSVMGIPSGRAIIESNSPPTLIGSAKSIRLRMEGYASICTEVAASSMSLTVSFGCDR
jgi:hypothetical protein